MNIKRLKKNSQGVSFTELILIVAIIAILSAATVPLGINFLRKGYLKNTRDVLVSYLNSAHILSIGPKNGTGWGVYVTPSDITLFSGTSYATRNSAFDSEYEIPAGVNIDPSEITFTKYTGKTSQTSIYMEGADGSSHTISVNSNGDISYE